MSLRVRLTADGTCDYARLDWRHQHHHARWVRRVEAMPKPLFCQDCGGCGEVICDRIDEYTIMEVCGWCEGTGFVTPYRRGEWLRYRASLKGSK